MADRTALPPAPPTDAPGVPWSRVERFVGLFTHDIRNGLNALELQLTLLNEISDDADVKAEVKNIRGSIADLTRKLQQVRTAAGTQTPRLFPYPASEFVEDLRDRFQRQDAESAARAQWEIEAVDATISIDPELSMTALIELLANALQHTPDGDAVRVHAARCSAGLVLSIHQTLDAAPSTSPDDWGRAPLLSSRRDGYGLGAFRARRIIEAQGGSLDCAYQEADKSLVTKVMLPSAPAAS